MDPSAHRYCVIGAGAAGLATLAVLLEHGFDVTAYERTDRVGGHWHTDYESLHLITSRNVSGFEGFPMPDHYPTYPSRDQMRDYLLSFADAKGLAEHIRFGVEVTSVRPRGDVGLGGWTVEAADGTIEQYDAVIVANGHLWDPNVPEYDGTFTGKTMHSSSYRNIDDIEGRRVLVVGAGNSGCDLAVDVANARLDSFISVRRGQMFQPKAIFGKPRAELKWLGKLPLRIQERVSRAARRHRRRTHLRVPGPPPARDTQPEQTATGRQQPPALLDPPRTHHGRTRHLPLRRPHRALHRRLAARLRHGALGHGLQGDLPLPRSCRSFAGAMACRCASPGSPCPVGSRTCISPASPGREVDSFPSTPRRQSSSSRMLHLTEKANIALSREFAKIDEPDARIDIIRKVWLTQMSRANAAVDKLEREHAAALTARLR